MDSWKEADEAGNMLRNLQKDKTLFIRLAGCNYCNVSLQFDLNDGDAGRKSQAWKSLKNRSGKINIQSIFAP